MPPHAGAHHSTVRPALSLGTRLAQCVGRGLGVVVLALLLAGSAPLGILAARAPAMPAHHHDGGGHGEHHDTPPQPCSGGACCIICTGSCAATGGTASRALAPRPDIGAANRLGTPGAPRRSASRCRLHLLPFPHAPPA